MIQTNSFSSINALGLDAADWNALAAESETNTVFQTHEWVSTWERIYGGECRPWFISVQSSAGLLGIAPLMIKEGLLRERTVQFLGEGKADYCDFLSAGDRAKAVEAICRSLFEARERWDVVELNNIPVNSSTVELVRKISSREGYRTLLRDLYLSPTLLIRGREDEALKIFNKASLRRRHNYFQREAQLTFKVITGSAVLSYLDEFFAQHVERWTGSESPSLFLDVHNKIFYRELAVAMAEKNWLMLSVVDCAGRSLAMHYGFDYNDRVLWYKPSFNKDYAKHSPGLVLLRYLIGYALDRKRGEFDFTIGDEPFKTRFSNHMRTTVSLQIFRDPARYYLELSRQKLSAAKKRLL